jgi:hypothetical protein
LNNSVNHSEVLMGKGFAGGWLSRTVTHNPARKDLFFGTRWHWLGTGGNNSAPRTDQNRAAPAPGQMILLFSLAQRIFSEAKALPGLAARLLLYPDLQIPDVLKKLPS